MVFSGIYPVESGDYDNLRTALEKLQPQRQRVHPVEPDDSATRSASASGCGFLGLLHMEIIQERLEREYDLDLITTAPNGGLPGEDARTGRRRWRSTRPASCRRRRRSRRSASRSPSVIRSTCPRKFVGRGAEAVRGAARRPGQLRLLQLRAASGVVVTYDQPYAEVVFDFFDKLKSVLDTRATPPWTTRWSAGVRPDDLVKLDILVNGEVVDALSRDRVTAPRLPPRGQALARKLKEFIPRQMFEVAIQAAIGSGRSSPAPT